MGVFFDSFLAKTIDLSSLVFDGDLLSQSLYGLLLLSSIISVCMSFAGILKNNKLPVVIFYRSAVFIKIFSFILTKILIQSYIFSIAIKSIMWYVILPVSELGPVFQYYYRGLCYRYFKKPEYNHGFDIKCNK